MGLKYKTLKEFKKDYPKECDSLKHKKLLIKLCEDMGWDTPKPKKKTKPNGYWTKERCMEEASKYTTKPEWVKNSSPSLQAARRNGWYKECSAHMIELQKPSKYWTKERCIEDAKNYSTRSEWARNNESSYGSARKNGWVDECATHMVELIKPMGYWTKERCIEIASKYDTIKEWRKNHQSCYQSAVESKILNECTSHMTRHFFKWTPELCLEDALKYQSRFEWQKKSQAYAASRRFGCYEECISHMVEILKPSGYWNIKENCLEEARKHKTKTQWQKKSSGSFNAAKRNSWIEECTKHMINYGKKI